jgi:iron uptake system component EfeO
MTARPNPSAGPSGRLSRLFGGRLATTTAVVATVVVVAGTLAACGSDSKKAAGASSTASTASSSSSRVVAITITSAGCAPTQTSYTSGPLTFNVANKDATGVTEIELLSDERILGEKENLPPGFNGTFALSLDAGDYTIYCPGATTEKNTIKVTGTKATAGSSDSAALLKAGTITYGTYVSTQVTTMATTADALNKALHGTDLVAAQNAYMVARPYYERIEPVAESFTVNGDDLDAAIDARADDVPIAQLTGYHRIEYGLFDQKSLAGLGPIGDGLVANIASLQKLTTGLTYQPAELANGAVDLLGEVQQSKITGEEERYSHIDMLDFQGNVEGAEQAFANLEPGLKLIDAALSAQVATAFTALDTVIDKYRTKDNASGFVFYSVLTDADRTALSQALQAVNEPLSKVAGKVVGS